MLLGAAQGYSGSGLYPSARRLYVNSLFYSVSVSSTANQQRQSLHLFQTSVDSTFVLWQSKKTSLKNKVTKCWKNSLCLTQYSHEIKQPAEENNKEPSVFRPSEICISNHTFTPYSKIRL